MLIENTNGNLITTYKKALRSSLKQRFMHDTAFNGLKKKKKAQSASDCMFPLQLKMSK